MRRQLLKRWLRDPYITDTEVTDIRAVLDWDYYIERLGLSRRFVCLYYSRTHGRKAPFTRNCGISML